MNRSHLIIAGIVLAVLAVFLLATPFPQPRAYFAFADDRTFFGVPNFWNVASNALFLVPGVAGLWLLARQPRAGVLPALNPAYHILFTGILLTAFGSAWFHLAPNLRTLFWDRLPMTIAFMSLAAIVVGEHVDAKTGKYVLWPLLAIGAASVLYWDWSEGRDAGDLRLYGIVQFLPMLLIPVLLLTYRSAFDRTGFLWMVLTLYALAKGVEYLDREFYNLGETVSGHTVKHLLAALAATVLVYGIMKRRVRDAD